MPKVPQKVSLRLLVSLVVCLLAVGFVFAPDAAEPEKDFAGQPAYQVLRVIDGDTIEVELEGRKEKVRYIGINAPELHETFGFKASRANRELVDGQTVKLEFDEQRRDQYGRTLAYVYVQPAGQPQWVMVNAELLRRGLACVTTYPPNLRHQEHFGRLQDEARKGRLGLWADPGAVAQIEVVRLREDLKRLQAENAQLRAEVQRLKKQVANLQAKLSAAQRAPTAAPGVPRPAPRTPVVTPTPRERKAEPAEEVTVYITRTGKKYHRGGCRYLSKSQIPISLSEAKRSHGPCSVCSPPR